MITKITEYYNLIRKSNSQLNLISSKEEGFLETRHYIDSIELSKIIQELNVKNVLDMGTGQGLPIIPCAIINPEVEFSCVESTKKKCDFMINTIQTLNISNVKVFCERLEDFGRSNTHRKKYDLVTARALAALNILIELSAPLLKQNGYGAYLKGRNLQNELNDSKKILQLTGMSYKDLKEYQDDSFDTPAIKSIIVFIRDKKLNLQDFPRTNGIPFKKPII